MELCAVVSLSVRESCAMGDSKVLFSRRVPTPLHMAVLLRLSGNAGSTAKLTSELAD